ncbi:hypothetical protein METBIDRAFT_29451 [Metschnikowia bicuspidata var. bicuspidata NRRL YB-4993]|uniref:Uncharacterized protein n=1 Tax=Metschnikowia bicuspidata var. bicuspidata NRRL YB-4993 TaxID=869754 RepID=A0A1A0HG87_9ASCO|nr:hypothetical protein METBIDRAFT_29451 [Metschnikowia bicuspidata var. bicuspidata NRRL YB-4993]OBA22873.1 hypothetical protein METBIDRAFT_29451 [Metschnikowia bicuspidata var. bicuspidata NRRL YB-4993]
MKRWRKFWKDFYKQEWLVQNDLTAIHLFNHGSYVPLHDDEVWKSRFECRLCLKRCSSDQKLTHLYNECETVHFWWKKSSFPARLRSREMLAPLDTFFDCRRNPNWLVKVVRKA